MGMDIRKRLGSFGDPDPDNIYGIYQMRTRFGHRINVKEKFYVPTNPQTVPQQANRQDFADAVVAWQGLSDSQKQVYNKRARTRHMSGYNLFLRQKMLS